jgi:hypothetical protein
MPKFYYTVKGTADETANAGVVDAADQDEALTKLNSTYGNTEDNQLVEINFIDSDAFNKLEAERGNELTHKVE